MSLTTRLIVKAAGAVLHKKRADAFGNLLRSSNGIAGLGRRIEDKAGVRA